MNKILPILAVAGLAAACGKVDNDHEHCNHANHSRVVAPAVVAAPAVVSPVPSQRVDGTYRPDGTYAVAPVIEDHGYQHKHSDDALSDRSLGATRGSHGQPMTHKDSDHDGNYDYVPSYRTRAATYYYTY